MFVEHGSEINAVIRNVVHNRASVAKRFVLTGMFEKNFLFHRLMTYDESIRRRKRNWLL